MPSPSRSASGPLAPAEAVRNACIEAALQAYEDAGLSGLCQEGRWECAIEAMRGLDLARVLAPVDEAAQQRRGDVARADPAAPRTPG